MSHTPAADDPAPVDWKALDELRAKATKLPWHVVGGSVQSSLGYVADLSSPRGPEDRDANAAFIVALVNAYPALRSMAGGGDLHHRVADQQSAVSTTEKGAT